MQKSCLSCGSPFEAKRKAAKYCSERCRKWAQRHPDEVRPPQAARPAAAAPPGAGREPDCIPGPVELQVRADIDAMITAHPAAESLAEMSYALARQLDTGAGFAAAGLNRELRANLAELSRLAVDDGDDLADELSRPDLPSEIRNREEP